MILIRIDRIVGDVKIPGYKDWFTATSISFEVATDDATMKKRKGFSKTSKERDIEFDPDEEDDANPRELQIDKTVDAATVYLMHAAMKARKGGTEQEVSVDIHFCQNRDYEALENADKKVRPYLKIRLENAYISTWGIDGSDDERPTESLTLCFNKAAMSYRASVDGKVFQTYGPHGWDQEANVDWTPSGWDKEKA